MRQVVMSAVAALVDVVSFAASKAQAARQVAPHRFIDMGVVKAGCVRYGPYPTKNRASQIAAYFQRQGDNAHMIPWNTTPDSYYVDVWL